MDLKGDLDGTKVKIRYNGQMALTNGVVARFFKFRL